MACGGSAGVSNTDGSMSSNTTGNTNYSANGTTQNTTPDWVSNGIQGLLSQIQGLGNVNPQSYIAPTTANQNQAGSNASVIGSMAPVQSEAATQTAAGGASYQPQQVTGSTALPGISQYLNASSPFQQQVANTSLQQLNQANQLALNDVNQGAALSGGYGSSRQGVAQGLTNNQFANQSANMLSNLNLQGYNSALGASNDDANRAQAAATSNQQAGLAGQGINLAGAGLLGNLAQSGQSDLASTGATQQQTNQAQAQAPLSVLQSIQQMTSGLPLNLFSGTSSTGTGATNNTSATNGNNSSTSEAGQASFG